MRVRILWGDTVLSEDVLSPPREYWLGEGHADFVLPAELLGAERLRLVRVEAGRVIIAGECELVPGPPVLLSFGGFFIEISLEDAIRAAGWRRWSGPRILPYFVAPAALAAAILGCAAASPPLTDDDLYVERLRLMQYYLSVAEERERDAELGTKAAIKRYGVRGPGDAPAVSGAQTARQATLRSSSQFGMVGLLNAASAGQPWGRDTSLGEPSDNWGDPNTASGEGYADHGVNGVVDPAKDRVSTFAVDVDTGAYTIAKRKLLAGILPPLQAVRVEEFVNAFEYDYSAPEEDGSVAPFAVHLDAAPSPFDAQKHFLRVGVQGRRVRPDARPPVNLVYLVDTSGSMQSYDKIGFVQYSLRLLTSSLTPRDTVAICTYAGFVREVLAPTPATDRRRILDAIENLRAEGSTAMASGIDLAYKLAARSHVPGEISRVVVLSDGDANVGPASADEILEIIREHKRRGITLSTVGYGQGNYKDAMMERLADAGDGNYSYIGDQWDAKRVFVDQVGGLLQVIARDVKVQVDFDPRMVESYRLIGYENRDVADHLFRDDTVDGGEVGAGHAVTALYELRLRDTRSSPVTVRVRHKPALAGDQASELSVSLPADRIVQRFEDASHDFQFAVSVAAFAEALRGSRHALGWDLESIEQIAHDTVGRRPERAELVSLIATARALRAGS